MVAAPTSDDRVKVEWQRKRARTALLMYAFAALVALLVIARLSKQDVLFLVSLLGLAAFAVSLLTLRDLDSCPRCGERIYRRWGIAGMRKYDAGGIRGSLIKIKRCPFCGVELR